MEDWQKDHIRANLVELLSYTVVSTNLLASLEANNVLSGVDVDRISALPVNADKVYQLYRILQTKLGGYVALLDALDSTKQSGALRVLLSSIPSTIFGKLAVIIGTANVLLADLLSQSQIEDYISWVKNNINVDIYKTIFCSRAQFGDPIQLVTPCIPKSDPLYVPRYLSRRLLIDAKVFKVEANDIFVFKNISRLKLRNLVGYTNAIECSSEQLFKITCRFILLDKETHWNELRNKATSPTHLVADIENDGTFYLLQTTGGSEILHKYLKHGTNETGISESEFVSTERTENEKGLCICDSPGMGKTMLLANLARAIQGAHPDRIICFTPLSRLSQVMKEKGFSPINFETCKNFLLDWMSNSPFTKYLLQILLGANLLQMELFFDGLDEVQPDQMDTITTFLESVLDNISMCRIYATSRTHVRQELESATRFIAYDILPFDEEVQIQYLVSSWQKEYPANAELRLHEFATRCVRDFQKNVGDKERKLLGIPLQCKMFADIYSESARIHSLIDERIKVNCHFVTNVWEMYKLFMEQRIDAKSECNFQCMLKPGSDWLSKDWEVKCSKNCKIKCCHVWMALKTIFPSFTDQFSQKVVEFTELSLEDVLGPGVLVNDAMDKSVQFLHRSFAEYLCADFFASQLLVGMKKGKGSRSLSKLAVIFFTKHLVETTYVESDVDSDDSDVDSDDLDVDSDDSDVDSDIDSEVFDDFLPPVYIHPLVVHFCEKFAKSWSEFDYTQLFNSNYLESNKDFFYPVKVTCAALKSDHSHLLQFFLHLYLQPEISTSKHYVPEFLENDTKLKLLNTATEYSAISTINILIDLFKNLANIDLLEVCQSLKRNERSPLDIAARNLEFVKVLLFYDKVKPDGRGLVYRLVEGTHGADKETAEKVKDICNLLLEKYPSLLLEENANYTGPVAAEQISLELVLYLVEKGADIRAVDKKYKHNLIYNSTLYMDGADFHRLTEFVIYDQKSPDLFTSTDDWDSPMSKIFRDVKGLKLETVQLIFSQTAANVNELDYHEYNLTQCAIKGHQSIEIIKYLKSRGVSLAHRSKTDGNSLHIAVMSSSDVAVKYITSLNCTDIEVRDGEGRTPILVAAQKENLEMIEHLYSLGANLFELDNKGRSILMNYLIYYEDPHKIHTFVTWLKQKCELTCPLVQTFNELGLPNINKNCLSELFGLPNKRGETPIMVAFRYSFGLLPGTLTTFLEYDKSRLGKFLKHPVDINAADEDGLTVLHACVHGWHPVSAAKMLLENGVDWKIKDKHQCNITHDCVRYGCDELLKYFVGLGCDVNELDQYGNNALQCSFHFNNEHTLNEETLTALVHSGLSFHNVNRKGQTALMMLRKSEYYKIYKNLSKFEHYFQGKRL